jgi:hypothetical protein
MLDKLSEHPLRKELIHHPFLKEVRTGSPVTKETVATLLGQWWYPLDYFPTFLSRSISVLPNRDMQTALSKILYQELGEGRPDNSHGKLFITTMAGAGFDEETTTQVPAFEETRKLVELYEETSHNALRALGAVYGTEVVDLAMVSGVGRMVRAVSGVKELPWVDIHVQQEPEHVEQASEALEPDFTAEEEAQIVRAAEDMWKGWISFFDRIRAETRAEAPVAVAAH